MSYSINLNKNINPDTPQRLCLFVFTSTFICYQTKSEVRKCVQIFDKYEVRIAKGKKKSDGDKENDIYCSSIGIVWPMTSLLWIYNGISSSDTSKYQSRNIPTFELMLKTSNLSKCMKNINIYS